MKKIVLFYLIPLLFFGEAVNADEQINICDRGEIGQRIAKELQSECHSVSKGKLASIQNLILGGMDIQSIPTGAFLGMPSLEVLDLSNNSFKEIAIGSLNGLINLKKLYINTNYDYFSIEPGAFFDLPTLVELQIVSQHFYNINPGIFAGLSKLEILLIESNRHLTTLKSDLFKELKSLKVLRLNSSQIFNIEPFAFSGLENLEELDLGYNSIKEVKKDTWAGLKNIKDLSLYSNRISYVEKSSFSGIFSSDGGALVLEKGNMTGVSKAYLGLPDNVALFLY